MPNINVTLKEGASTEKLEEAKQAVRDQGGSVEHEYKLIKGFSASIPDDAVSTLQSNDHVHVEEDKEVRTQ